mmetsp:Transcript_27816/g.77801  ORF Transcript_27816/g.77801 Transcript_27816/m.77801 type:complete len:325 (+) Transcript_27816:917-1891(+)
MWRISQPAARCGLLGRARLPDEESELERNLHEALEPAGLGEVPRPHVALEEQGVGVGLRLAQLGHPLRGLPVRHAGVVQPRRDEEGGVRLGPDVVHRAVALHVVVELFGLHGVAPLLPLSDGERDGVVQHRRDDVHEGDARDRSCEEVRAHVHGGAHSDASGRPAFDAHLGRVAHLLGHQVLRAGDEIGHSVPLLQELPVLVPHTPHLAPPPDVRHREHKPAVQQRQPRGAEVRVVADLIAAVAVEQQRGSPVELHEVLPPHEAHGDGDPVGRRGPHALGGVVLLAEAAQHGRHLLHRPLPAHHVVVQRGVRGGHARVLQAQHA